MYSCKITITFVESIKNKSSMKIWKVREIISLIESDDRFLIRTGSDHRQFKHLIKKGKVTVPGKLSDDIDSNTAKSILIQAELL